LTEELAGLERPHDTTTGEDLFVCVCVCVNMKVIDLPWTKLKGVKTDGAPSMTEKRTV